MTFGALYIQFLPMNIEDFRKYCLSLGDVTEKTPFGKFARRFDSILVFYVLDHMFCFVDMDDFSSVTVKSTPYEIVKGKYTPKRKKTEQKKGY